MKKLEVGFLVTFSILFLASSFISGSNVLNGSNYNKQFGVELGIVAFTCFGILLLLRKRDAVILRFTISDTIVILLSIIYWLFDFFHGSPPLVKNVPVYYLLFYFMLKLVLSNIDVVNTERSFKLVLACVPYVILAHVAIVIIQKLQLSLGASGKLSWGSTFGNPDMLGSYLAVLIPFCFMQLRSFKIFGIGAFLLSLGLLLLLQARTSIVALTSCGLLWILLNYRIKLTKFLLLLALPICIIFILIIWHPESVFGRFFIWLVSIKMIALKPFGWGLFAFERDFPEIQAYMLPRVEPMMRLFTPEVVHSPFNELLNIGVTIGALPLVLFLILGYIIFYNLHKAKDITIYPILTFFIISLTYFPFKIAPIIVIIIPIVAYISNKDPYYLHLKFSKFYGSVLFLIMFNVSLALSFKTVHTYILFNRWQYCYSLLPITESNLELEHYFVQLYPVLRTDGRFLITYSNYLQGIGKTEEGLGLLEEATQYFCDVTLSLQLAHLYEHRGFLTLAEEKYDLAISLAPTKLTAAFEKVLFLQRTGRLNEAYIASLEILSRPVEDSKYADTYLIINKLQKLKNEIEQGLRN